MNASDNYLMETTFLNALSNLSPVSSTPKFRAASMNRSDWALSVDLGFCFAFGFDFFAGAIPTPSLNSTASRRSAIRRFWWNGLATRAAYEGSGQRDR